MVSAPLLVDSPAQPTAVIVSAGRGSRLLPLTEAMPKCLVPVGGRAILDHQLDALAEAGIERAVVVAGYRVEQVADHLAASRRALSVELIFNPFWAVANSIGSVWAAHAFVAAPFVLMNGDTVFEAAVLRAALTEAQPGVNLVVERTDTFAADDMRVAAHDCRVMAVSKTLGGAAAGHRSLGLIVSRDADGGGYADALRQVIAAPDGVQAYHHAVIDRLAHQGRVHAIDARGGWCEIDRPQDIAAWSLGHGDPIGAVA